MKESAPVKELIARELASPPLIEKLKASPSASVATILPILVVFSATLMMNLYLEHDYCLNQKPH